MKLKDAKAAVQNRSAEYGCTVYLCASFKPWNPDNRGFNFAEVDPDGYRVDDFYDGSVIGRCDAGKWRQP